MKDFIDALKAEAAFLKQNPEMILVFAACITIIFIFATK